MYCASLVSFGAYYSHLFITALMMVEMVVFYFISINKSLFSISAHLLSFFNSSLYPTGEEGSENAIAKYFISS